MDDKEPLTPGESADYGATSGQPPPDPPSSPGAEDAIEAAPQEMELNEVYQLIGFGPAQYIYYLTVALISYSEYAELTCLSVMTPLLRCEWNLTTNFEAAITISVFGSYALFALIFGKLSDQYGRKVVLQWSTVCLLLAAVAAALAPNKWVFLFSRLVTGATIGINLNCSLCYATEFAESKYRTVGVTVFIVSASAGFVIVNLFAYLVLEEIGWRWFIIIISLPAIPALALIIALPESPRYHVVSGEQEEALKTVTWFAKLAGKPLPADLTVKVYQDQERGSLKTLFSSEYKQTVLALSAVYFANIFVEFGLIIFLPLLFSSDVCSGSGGGVPEHTCKPLSKKDLWELTLASAGGIFGCFLSLILATQIGRIAPVRVGSGVQTLFLTLLLFCISEGFTFYTAVIVKIVQAFINCLIWIVIPESFPTIIRSTALGIVNGSGKVGGLIGTGMVYLLFYESFRYVVCLFILASVVGFVGSLFLHVETKDTELQDA